MWILFMENEGNCLLGIFLSESVICFLKINIELFVSATDHKNI